MPRQLDGTALFRKLLSLDLYKISTGTFGDTTTTAPVIGDGSETTIGVTATTNFTAADYAFCIGDGGTELFKIGTPAVSMPITYKPKIPQSTGARFVEATKVSLGKLGEGGVNITPSKSLTAINSSVDDFPINYLDGVLEVSFSVPLLEWSNVNWALITGYADDETGAGTTGDPYQTIIGKINQTLQGSQVFRLTGIRFDGKYGQIDLLDAHVEVSQGIEHNRQAPAVMVLAGKCTKLIARQATAAFPW